MAPAMKWVVKSDEPAKEEKEEKPAKAAGKKAKKEKEEPSSGGKGKSAAKASSADSWAGWAWSSDGWGGSDWDWGWEESSWAKESKESKRSKAEREEKDAAKGKGKAKEGKDKGAEEKAEKGKGKSKSEGKSKEEKWKKEEEKAYKGKKDEERDAKGKAKGGKDAGGKGKFSKGDKGDAPQRPHVDLRHEAPNAKYVHEVEENIVKAAQEEARAAGAARPDRASRQRGPDSIGKQPIEAKGDHCQVHKHSGMGCCVVSLESHAARETLMRFAESRFPMTEGSHGPKVEMEIGGVKVQIKRHTDKATKREVVTDIFVAWGHQQEKETPLTVNQIGDYFDAVFKQAAEGGAGMVGQMGFGGLHQQTAAAAAAAQLSSHLAQPMVGGPRPPMPPHHAPGMPGQALPPGAHPQMQANPAAYYADYAQRAAMMYNPAAMIHYQHQLAYQQQQQQAAIYAYHQQMALQQQQQQQLQQQQLLRQAEVGQKGGKDGKGKPEGAAEEAAPLPAGEATTAPAAAVPVTPGVVPPAAPGEVPAAAAAEGAAPPSTPPRPAAGEGEAQQAEGASPPEERVRDYAPARPRLLQIIDPVSGKPIDTIGMNFAPRKTSSPLKIIDPNSGEAISSQEKAQAEAAAAEEKKEEGS